MLEILDLETRMFLAGNSSRKPGGPCELIERVRICFEGQATEMARIASLLEKGHPGVP